MGTLGAYHKADMDRQAFEYQAKVAGNNALLEEWQASDALVRGGHSEQAQRLRTAQLKGTQRASMAARGVALDEGSPLSILQDTEYMGELDAATIRSNAEREAWGHRTQATNYRNDSLLLSARASASDPNMAAVSSLLSGGGQVAASWYGRKT